jgi:hypothetical protein
MGAEGGEILTGPIFSTPSYIQRCWAGMKPPLACTVRLRARSEGTTTCLRKGTRVPVKEEVSEVDGEEPSDRDATWAAMAEAAAAAVDAMPPAAAPAISPKCAPASPAQEIGCEFPREHLHLGREAKRGRRVHRVG